MRGGAGQAQVPGDKVPYDRTQQPTQDDVGIYDADIDQPLADGLCHRSADHECGNEVEERRPHHRHSGLEHPGGNDSCNGVGAVVKAIDEVEDQRNSDDDEDIQNVVIHAQACLMEMDSSTFPASSIWSRVFSSVS